MPYKSYDHTFVVCAYGESPYLLDCLNSLRNQSLPSKIIVSTTTPNTHIANLCAKYSIEMFINKGLPGIGRDWNRALSHVKTPLATIAHQDDVYLPGYTESMLNNFNKARNPLIYFCDYGEIRDSGIRDGSALLRIKRLMLLPLRNRNLWRNISLRRLILAFGSPIGCPAVSYNLEKLSLPLFNEKMKCSLDWDAWERISKLQGEFIYESSIHMRHRIHSESETSHLIEDDTRTKEDYEMMRRFWPRPIARYLTRLYKLSQKSNREK